MFFHSVHFLIQLVLFMQETETTATSTDETMDTSNRTKIYSLSVVRLSDPQHVQLALINVTDSTQTTYMVCASTAQDSPAAYSSSEQDSAEEDSGDVSSSIGVPPCDPNTALAVNVSSETKWVSLQPGLLFPDVEGIRVEVKGQVLSQGGDVGADQIADTSGRSNSSSRCFNQFSWLMTGQLVVLPSTAGCDKSSAAY